MGPKPVPALLRIVRKLRVTTQGCLEWYGATNGTGYGVILDDGPPRKMTYVHRKMFEIFNYKIPKGMVIDHLCRNRACCLPDHLEAVSPTENMRRGEAPNWVARRKGECKRGHLYSVYGKKNSADGRVRCGECNRIRERERRNDAK